ncbi:MAG TPA: glucokinase [Terriglobales bacterium]|nr:glucokinase [Terriglobales bacterium]
MAITETRSKSRIILAGDVGGTKCNLALFQENGAALDLIFQRRYATKDYASLSFPAVIRDFFRHAAESGASISGKNVTAAGFGCAGAVVNDRFHSANLPWVIAGQEVAGEMGLKSVAMLNDLEATAHSLDHLPPKDLLVLNQGVAQLHAAKALLAAGTGLGEAILFWNGQQYHAAPGEGGMADFTPHSEREIELLRFLKKRMSHVCAEEVLSGRGFVVIHEFLDASVRHSSFDSSVAEAAREITQNTVAGSCPICTEALDIWVSAYGSEAGNLALRVLAFAGVYVAGGIAIKILSKMQDGTFLRAFCDKGGFAPILARVPIHIVLNEDAPLWGAAYRALASATI